LNKYGMLKELLSQVDQLLKV